MRVFIGVDPRDVVSFKVLEWSIQSRSSRPVSITPLILPQLPITRTGLTEFTYSRYLVPALCGYEGRGLFLDSDMLCLGDIAELFDMEFSEAVAVVKGERFEWPSLMLFNCAECRTLTPEYVENESPQLFEWGEVAALPQEWNHCVGYDEPTEDVKLVHYTMGTPHFKELRGCEYAPHWWREYRAMTSQSSWLEVHGMSVHRDKVLEGLGLGA